MIETAIKWDNQNGGKEKMEPGITYRPIGQIHTPFTDPKGMPIQPAGARDVEGRVEVFPEFRAGLIDLEGFSHLILLYHFHRSKGYTLEVVPYMDSTTRGVFATRAPRRPNPIGLSVVRLDRIEDGILFVRDVDILDGTPLLDIKPYVPEFDSPIPPIRIGWLAEHRHRAASHRADGRFA